MLVENALFSAVARQLKISMLSSLFFFNCWANHNMEFPSPSSLSVHLHRILPNVSSSLMHLYIGLKQSFTGVSNFFQLSAVWCQICYVPPHFIYWYLLSSSCQHQCLFSTCLLPSCISRAVMHLHFTHTALFIIICSTICKHEIQPSNVRQLSTQGCPNH